MTNKFLRQDGWFQPVDSASIVPSTVATGTGFLGSLTKATTADIGLTALTTTDGPSVSQGSSGVWYVCASLTLASSGTITNISSKLWDGTTVIASQSVSLPVNSFGVVALAGVIVNPAGNLKTSSFAGNPSVIRANASTYLNDSSITAIRIG